MMAWFQDDYIVIVRACPSCGGATVVLGKTALRVERSTSFQVHYPPREARALVTPDNLVANAIAIFREVEAEIGR